jgi:hypothetical protein
MMNVKTDNLKRRERPLKPFRVSVYGVSPRVFFEITSDQTKTAFGDPREKMNSQYGKTSYLEWLQHEQARWTALNRTLIVVQKVGNGRVALADLSSNENEEE